MAACVGPSVEDAEANLCQDLNGFAGALNNLAQLNAQSTVQELETTKQDIVVFRGSRFRLLVYPMDKGLCE